MKNTGEILNKKRQELGYSIEDISNSTKISSRIIKAIEEGHQSVLPSLSYTRGFIRTYAKHLKLNPDELIKSFNQELENTSDTDSSAQGSPPPNNSTDHSPKKSLEASTSSQSSPEDSTEESKESTTPTPEDSQEAFPEAPLGGEFLREDSLREDSLREPHKRISPKGYPHTDLNGYSKRPLGAHSK